MPTPLTRRTFLRTLATTGGSLLLPPALTACDVREFARAHGAKQRLSIATSAAGSGFYVYGGGVAKLISAYVPNAEATAEVTSASVDNLKFLRDGKADLALTTADTLADAYEGRGAFKEFGKVPARALARLYTNQTHVVTLAGKGLDRLADLKGRVVSTGPAGSGTEQIAARVLRAAGVDPAAHIRRQRLAFGVAADALKDGKIDAFFMSAGVPNGFVLDIASTPGRTLTLIPSADVLPILQREYGPTLYYHATIPRAAYPDLTADVPVVGVGTFLVVDESMGEVLAYEITKVLFDHQPELEAIHPEGRHLRPESAVTGSPVPFHAGAVRFYREARVWPG